MMLGQILFKFGAADIVVPAVVPYPILIRRRFDDGAELLLSDVIQPGGLADGYNRLVLGHIIILSESLPPH